MSFARLTFKVSAMYRLEFWLRILTNLVAMYGAYWLWNRLYAQSPGAFPIRLEQMLTYGMLAMALDSVLFNANNARYYITRQVRSGDIQMDLLRPLDFQFQLLARNAGEMLLALLVIGLPAFITGAVFLGLRPPAGWLNGLLFFASLVPAWLIGFSLSFLLGAVSVFTLSIARIGWVYAAMVRFFSGQLVPLWFFPAVLGTVAAWLPFRGMIAIPLSIYIGQLSIPDALGGLAFQGAWAAALFLLCRWVWSRAKAKLTVQGG